MEILFIFDYDTFKPQSITTLRCCLVEGSLDLSEPYFLDNSNCSLKFSNGDFRPKFTNHNSRTTFFLQNPVFLISRNILTSKERFLSKTPNLKTSKLDIEVESEELLSLTTTEPIAAQKLYLPVKVQTRSSYTPGVLKISNSSKYILYLCHKDDSTPPTTGHLKHKTLGSFQYCINNNSKTF